RRRHTISKRDWSSDVCSNEKPFSTSYLLLAVSKKHNSNLNCALCLLLFKYHVPNIPPLAAFLLQISHWLRYLNTAKIFSLIIMQTIKGNVHRNPIFMNHNRQFTTFAFVHLL